MVENIIFIEYHETFEHEGVRYDIVKFCFPGISRFNYTVNGYIEVLEKSPWYKVHYLDIDAMHDIDIHGGLTYSGSLEHLGENDSKWFIGFDTNHFNDDENTKNLEYVKKECEKFINVWKDMLLGENLSFNVPNYVFRTMKNEEK